MFANATYQWVPDHFAQLPRVLAALKPGAVLAVQMPDNRAEPTHRLMVEVADDGRWATRLAHMSRAPLPPAGAYYDALAPLAACFDIWRTAYQHPLADAAAIVEFVRSTGLRPFLDALEEDERDGLRRRLHGPHRRGLSAARRRQGAAGVPASVLRRAPLSRALSSAGSRAMNVGN